MVWLIWPVNADMPGGFVDPSLHGIALNIETMFKQQYRVPVGRESHSYAIAE